MRVVPRRPGASDDDGRRRAGGPRDDRCRCACARSPASSSTRDRARPRAPAATTTTMPMPQLNTRCISSSATLPCRCSQSKIGGRGQRARSRRACRPSGSMRGTFSTQAAAGDVRHALDRQRRASARAPASRRCASARAARRAERASPSNGASRGRRRACVDDAADQREAVRVRAASTPGRAPRRPAAIVRPSMIARLLDDADGEAGEVVLAGADTCRASRRSRRRSARSPPARSPWRCP